MLFVPYVALHLIQHFYLFIVGYVGLPRILIVLRYCRVLSLFYYLKLTKDLFQRGRYVPARLKNLFGNNPHQDSNSHFNLVACVLSMKGTQDSQLQLPRSEQPAVIPRFFLQPFFYFYALLTAITDTLVQTLCVCGAGKRF